MVADGDCCSVGFPVRRFVKYPSKSAIGYAPVQRQSLGLAVILTLIALRVGIGMHFFREGLNKLRDPKPFSAGFFGNAKGPFAETYRRQIWDPDGLARLDLKGTHDAWDQFRAQVESHYAFDPKQKAQASDVQKLTEDQLTEHFAVNADDIDEYHKNLSRREKYRSDRQRMETPSLRSQIEKIEGDLKKTRSKLMAPIDLMWQGYARDLNSIATAEQRRSGLLQLAKPGRKFMDSEGVDFVIPWFDATLGVLLIVGLATRPAALVAAAFLFSIVVSQWPTATDSIATWPQFVEALGLLVIAASGAGQYAGLDALCSLFCCRGRCSTAKSNTSPTASAKSA